MPTIKLPLRFEQKLETNHTLLASIKHILPKYENIVVSEQPEFFPEYTNHGIQHVNKVLEAEDCLITDETFEYLTAEDIATLILATLFHDLGMHISFAGLKTLFSSWIDPVIAFDERSWKEEWDEVFFPEAKRYGDKKLNSLFGEIIEINKIDFSQNKLHDDDRLLIGEFLRQRHHRLAHEIARNGFPAKDGSSISLLPDEFDHKLADLSGLIARSHNLNLRDTFEYIQNPANGFGGKLKKPLKVHAIYIMILLRIADYLDLSKERTPQEQLTIRSFSSHYSTQSWKTHQAIIDVDRDEKDFEALHVHAEPKDNATFLQIEYLLGDIQRELDTSWAVLGEVYGVRKSNENMELSIRRIKSNIHDKVYQESLPYVSKEVSFKTDPELSKLLIEPLYGNEINYGVRELIQNAVDACKERAVLEGSEYEAEVVMEFGEENGKYFFRIIDNGIGMDEDVIINYFLNIGASFRNSSEWLGKFTDEEGHSKVPRNGRFGIGALAGFLLGKEIQIETSHLNNEETFTFTVSMQQEVIEIRRKTKKNIGTCIRIEIVKKDYETLLGNFEHTEREQFNYIFSWYRLTDINIFIRHVKGKEVNQIKYDPKIHVNWHEISHEAFGKILWSSQIRDILLHNGILVPKKTSYGYLGINDTYFDAKLSTLSLVITDLDNLIPLSLDRKEMKEYIFPFKNELLKSIAKEWLTIILSKQTTSHISEDLIIKLQDGLFNPSSMVHNMMFFSEGFMPLCFGYFQNNRIANFRIIMTDDISIVTPYLDQRIPVLLSFSDFFNHDDCFDILTLDFDFRGASTEYKHKYCFINKLSYEKDVDLEDKHDLYINDIQPLCEDFRDYFKDYADLTENWEDTFKDENKLWCQIERCYEGQDTDEKEHYFTIEILDSTLKMLVEYELDLDGCESRTFFNPNIDQEESTYQVMAEILQEYLGDDWLIPYEYEERKKKFANAFKRLGIE